MAAATSELVRPWIAAGQLVPLLEAWCGTFPGCFLYYPKQRYTPPSVRAFVDFLRRQNRNPDAPLDEA